jgi:hypothetical protein
MSKGIYYSLTQQNINITLGLDQYCMCAKSQDQTYFNCTMGLAVSISKKIYLNTGKSVRSNELNQQKSIYLTQQASMLTDTIFAEKVGFASGTEKKINLVFYLYIELTCKVNTITCEKGSDKLLCKRFKYTGAVGL